MQPLALVEPTRQQVRLGVFKGYLGVLDGLFGCMHSLFGCVTWFFKCGVWFVWVCWAVRLDVLDGFFCLLHTPTCCYCMVCVHSEQTYAIGSSCTLCLVIVSLF